LTAAATKTPPGVLALGCLLASLAIYCGAVVDFGGRPEEDAAMLLRYSRHLSSGRGIVWNIGEPPVDGATDFLFMLLVALLHRSGLSLESAAQGIGLAAHGATVALVYAGARRLHGASPALALVPATWLAFGPGLRHLTACYGTPLFALVAALAWWAATRAAQAEAPGLTGASLRLAFASLLLGLARPEGVFLGAFFLCAVIFYRGGDGALVLVSRFALVFLTLGLAYWLWRWQYFGHPLPNPFYKKGGGVFHLHSLRMAWRDLFRLTLPFLAVLVAGLFLKATRRVAAFTLLPISAFVVLWVLISDETNYVMRFRYPILPAVLMGFAGVAGSLLAPLARFLPPSSSTTLQVAGWTLALTTSVGLAAHQHARFRHVAPQRMGLYDAALVLRDYSRRNYALATTEAGLLPLYSTWRAVDAWGLNDAWIAHHGGVTGEYLDRYRPEVIIFHAYFSPETPESGPRVEGRSLGPDWYRMVMTLKAYAERNRYTLAAVFGRNAWDTHYYYVRTGFPDSAEMTERLRGLDYYWDGESTANFAPAP
jgi:arabinofuranosyltransferase